MDIEQSPAGKMVKTKTGYRAFLPNPLPPKLVWDNELVNALSRADYILGKLAREGNKLPNPHLLIRPFVTREAVLSSKIEGTLTSIGELLADEAGAHIDRSPDDVQEVKNYIVALEYGLKRINELPLSLRLIREIHRELMQGVRGKHATPGEFRTSQNWIGSSGSTLATAKYVPPTPDDLGDCLSAFELFLHDRSWPHLVHVALCHYQFEAIHPFLDGNGRVGRLLIILLLIERKILPSPILYLSAFFEATRSEYYRQLYNLSAHGTWHDWLIYFLNGIALQSEDVLSRAERINNLLTEWQLKVANGRSQLAVEIVKHLVVNPYFTTKSLAETFGVAFTTVQRALQILKKLDIITQTMGNKRERVFCATKILDILEEPAKIYSNNE